MFVKNEDNKLNVLGIIKLFILCSTSPGKQIDNRWQTVCDC